MYLCEKCLYTVQCSAWWSRSVKYYRWCYLLKNAKQAINITFLFVLNLVQTKKKRRKYRFVLLNL